MGQNASVLTPAPESDAREFLYFYVREPWRSENARELDALGGLERPPIARGQSMTHKLRLLQSHLQRQQREIQEVLAPLPPNPSDSSKATTLQPAGSAQFPPHVLLCDVRAAERSQQRKPLWPTDPESPDGLPNKDFVQPRWQSLSPEVLLQRRQQQLLRQKMLDFSRGVRAAKPGLPGQIEEQPVSNKGEQRYGYGSRRRFQTIVPELPPVASWRMRIHAARRRVMLIVLTCIRLQRGHKRANRLRRDSFSWRIQLALGPEAQRFAEEQTAWVQACRVRAIAENSLTALMEDRPSPIPTTPAPSLNSDRSTHKRFIGLKQKRAQPAAAPPTAITTDTNTAASQPTLATAQSAESMRASAHVTQGDLRRSISEIAIKGQGSEQGGVSDVKISDTSAAVAVSPFSAAAAAAAAAAANAPYEQHAHAAAATVPPAAAAAAAEPASAFAAASAAAAVLLDAAADAAATAAPTAASSATNTANDPLKPHTVLSQPTSTMSEDHSQQVAQADSAPEPAACRVSLGASIDGSPRGGMMKRWSSGKATTSASALRPSTATLRSSLSLPPRVTNGVATGVANSVTPAKLKLALPLPSPDMASQRVSYQGGDRVTRDSRRVSQSSSAGMLTPVSYAGSGASRSTPGSSRHVAHAKAELKQRIQNQESVMQRSRDLMSVFINRANGAWAEGCQWSTRSLHFAGGSVAEQQAFLQGDQWRVYRADLTRKLRNGQVVWLFHTEDSLPLPSQSPVQAPTHKAFTAPIWTLDPWQLLATFRPGSIPQALRRLSGVSVGGRVLSQLAQAVEQLAGLDAVRKLPVVLQVPSHNLQAVKTDLITHQMYGLNPERVYIIETQSGWSYAWDAGEKRFLRKARTDTPAPYDGRISAGSHDSSPAAAAPASSQRGLGPAYAVMQCGWPGEAVQLTPYNLDTNTAMTTTPTPTGQQSTTPTKSLSPSLGGSGPSGVFDMPLGTLAADKDAVLRTPRSRMQSSALPRNGWCEKRVEESVWDVLTASRAEWLVSMRGRDLAALGANGGPLDVPMLAYVLAMRDQCMLEMAEVGVQGSPVQARQADSVLLTCVAEQKGVAGGTTETKKRVLVPGGAAKQQRTVELRCCELGGGSQMAELQAAWGTISAGSGGNGSGSDQPAAGAAATPAVLAVGLQRYVFHVPSLVAAASKASTFSPKLSLQDGEVHVSHELSDLSRHLNCLAVAQPAGRGTGSAAAAAAVAAAAEAVDHSLPSDEAASASASTAPATELPLLTSIDDLDALVPLLIRQDRQPWVRRWALCGQRPTPVPLVPAAFLKQLAAAVASGAPLPTPATAPVMPDPDAPPPQTNQPLSLQVFAGFDLSPGGSKASSMGGGIVTVTSGAVVSRPNSALGADRHPTPWAEDSADRVESPLKMIAPGALLRRQQPANRIVVFLVANKLGAKALNLVATLARPQDQVFLVTVVARAEHESEGQAMLHGYVADLAASNVHAKTLVLVKGSRGLLDCMQDAVDTCRGTLAVMASKALTSNSSTGSTGNTSAPPPQSTKAGPAGLSPCDALAPYVVGSVTLSAIKRLTVPVAVVTTHTRNLAKAQQNNLSAVAVVEPHAKPMLHFLSSHCLDCLRGDRLLLVQHSHNPNLLTAQQAQVQRRVMEAFSDIANGHHLPPIHQLQFPTDINGRDMQELLVSQGVHLISVQVSRGTNRVLTPSLLHLLGSSPAAVLVYREAPGAAST